MENRSYEIIYRFKHENGNILQEVKYIDIPESSPKSSRYKWFLLKNGALKPLTFLSQNGTTRSFVEGTLTIYPEYCLFNGENYSQQNVSLPIVYSAEFYFHGIMNRTE